MAEDDSNRASIDPLFAGCSLSDSDLESLLARHGFADNYPRHRARAAIDSAAFEYHFPEPPTYRKVLPHVRRAGKLAAQLDDALTKCWPLQIDPDGLSKALQEVKEKAEKTAAFIKAKRIERGRHSPLWEWVGRLMVLYEQGTGLTAGYAWDNYAGAYTGPFLLFVHEVG